MKNSIRGYWALLVRYLRPQWRMVLAMATILFLQISFQLINPQIMRNFIDAAVDGEPMSRLVRLAVIFLVIAVFRQFTGIGLTYTSETVGWTATNGLRQDLAEHSLNQKLSFHNRHTPGELIERIDGDVTTLADFFSQFVVQLLGNAILLIGVVILLFREDWRVGLVIGVFVGVSTFVLYRLRNIAVPHWDGERQANADLFSFLEERLAATEDIRSSGAVDYVMMKFMVLMRKLYQKTMKANMMWNVFMNSLWTIFSIGTAIGLALSAYLFQDQIISIGSVYIIFQYTNMLERPVSAITRPLAQLQKSAASIKRIKRLLDEDDRIPD